MEDTPIKTNIESTPTVNQVPAVQNPNDNRGFNPRQGRGRFQRGSRRGRGRGQDQARSEYDQKVLDIARVTRVTKGGKRFSFRATVAIGDGKGKVGVGIGKGVDVSQSIQKAFNKAKRNLMVVPMVNDTIPYQVEAKYNSAMVLLKPAKSGVKAGGPVRIIAQLVGLKSLTGKLLSRTNNKLNIAMATLAALGKIRVSKIQTKNQDKATS